MTDKIPDHIAYYEIADYLAGKVKKLTDQGYIDITPPICALKMNKRYKKDSRASARTSNRVSSPTPTKAGKKK